MIRCEITTRCFGIYGLAHVQQMIEKNRKMIEYLADFSPYIWEQRKKARDVYANYKKNQTLLHTVMDDTDIEKLSFDIRNANNRITEKRRVIELKSRACETCGLDVIQFLTVHHRVPLSAGGSNCIDNYSILCSNCHHAVHHTKHIDYKFFDFFQSRGTLPKLIQLIEKTMNERVYRKIRMNAVEKITQDVHIYQRKLMDVRMDSENWRARHMKQKLLKMENALNILQEN